MPTREQIVKIHIAKNELKLDDDSYRDLIAWNFGGKTSCKALSEQEAGKLLFILRQKGWRPKRTTRPDDPMTRKILALWINMAKEGVVRDRSDRALSRFVKRVTGVDSLRFCLPEHKFRVIEALKSMRKRAEEAAA